MNHFIKQTLAWLIAFGMSTGSLAAGYYFITRQHNLNQEMAATGAGTDQDHSAGDESQEAKHLSDSAHANEKHLAGSAKPKGSDHHQAPNNDTGNLADDNMRAGIHAPQHESQDLDHTKKQKTIRDEEGVPTPNDQLAKKHPSWSYLKGATDGPHHWSDLSENFSICDQGSQQSPIDLNNLVYSHATPQLRFHYGSSKIHLENNGHTIQGHLVDGQHYLTVNGKKYDLAQFHFHSPGEHSVAGIPSDIELHFVHKNETGELAVVAVLINESSGKESAAFKPIWQMLPRTASTETTSKQQLQIGNLLPKESAYAHYQGSLTTPPCLEGVQWFVMTSPLTMSSGQVEVYSSIFQGPTNRPRQPLKGRQVLTNSPLSQSH